MAYASAKFARALCDRCGFEYKLLDLKKEWNNLKTCPNCFETKHPQLEPKPAISDPEALYEPRPNNDVEVDLKRRGDDQSASSCVGAVPLVTGTTTEVGAVTLLVPKPKSFLAET